MNARVLPRSEWGRLEATPFPAFPAAKEMSVVVVEKGDEIVATLTVLRATHFEGLWISREHRNAGVARSLLRLASDEALSSGDDWVFAAAEDDTMRAVLSRVGAAKLPIDSYVMRLGGE